MISNKTKNINSEVEQISIIKFLVLALVGTLGFFIFGIIGNAIAISIPNLSDREISGVTNFITYALLFITMLAVLNKDILKFKNNFKNWKLYLIGLGFGIFIIGIQLLYSNILNLFYTTNVSENEGALRSFITIYPVTSVIFISFIGPLCEELTYRVSIFGFLKGHKVWAYIISIVLFTLVHFDFASPNIWNEVANLPMYLFPAITLAIAYEKFGLPCSYTAHVTNNLFSVLSIIILNSIK